jgi:hypothetical protein
VSASKKTALLIARGMLPLGAGTGIEAANLASADTTPTATSTSSTAGSPTPGRTPIWAR